MDIGRRIAENLRGAGIAASYRPAEQVTSIADYEVVILGTGVYANKMLPAMTALAYRWGDQLASRITYLFCSGPLGAADPSAVVLPPDARQLVRITQIRDARMFGGAMWFDRLKATERATLRMWGSPPGDFRNWEDIAAWSQEIADAVRREAS
jgi:menaquinone-dependent protoporphyrinogen oxidase